MLCKKTDCNLKNITILNITEENLNNFVIKLKLSKTSLCQKRGYFILKNLLARQESDRKKEMF